MEPVLHVSDICQGQILPPPSTILSSGNRWSIHSDMAVGSVVSWVKPPPGEDGSEYFATIRSNH